MNLTGGRTTLKLNISALVLALIISIEVAYLTYRALGRFVWQDCLLIFIPALVMFIIRDRGYSYTFFFLHLVIAIEMFARCWSNYFDGPASVKFFLPEPLLLVLASLVCLAVYGLWVLICSTGVLIKKFKAPKSS